MSSEFFGEMNGILQLSDNDNVVSQIFFEDDLTICIEKWNGIKCSIICGECCKSEINGSMGFEIGAIKIKKVCESGDEFERGFILENSDYREYKELIFYDPWDIDRINFRAVAKRFILEDGK
ncbi:MAG: hypothetical protein K2K57_12065 [Oscillospiraceae bacterium]|nr:hypothetical protein [Oscillospiraceae bacterium]